MLHNVGWLLVTDVSGQNPSHRQGSRSRKRNSWTKDRTDRFSPKRRYLTWNLCRVTSQKSEDLNHKVAVAW